MKRPKTSGLEWLQHSITAFNGSGYASRESGEAFMETYMRYKTWRNQPDAVELAKDYYNAVLPLAQYLVENSEVDRVPSQKNLEKFNRVKI